jgi:hypothetical protein
MRVALAAIGCLVLAGCVRMPTEGPVVEPQVSTDVDGPPGFAFDPRPPQPGATADDIVTGFLEAMRATPVRPTVARQFLSSEAAERWQPEQQVITYAELGSPAGGSSVQVPMTDVNVYDARGAWQRTQKSRVLSLGLVEEDGEWRIDQAPDALVVPDSWFDDSYVRASLYFFDPTSQILVPEPVFVPRGEQFASSLVRGLLTAPSTESGQVVRSYFPPGTTPGLSVPIVSGIAEVSLTGDPDAVDRETGERMLAQLVWTLRQEGRINAVRLTVGGRAISFQDGSPLVPLGIGSGYDPNGEGASNDVYALSRGRVVSGDVGSFEETPGPLGQGDFHLRSLGVSISGSRVAAVSRSGSDLFVAPTESPTGQVTKPVVGAVDLAAPDWDVRDRIWVLDRNGGRARVIVVVGGVAGVVDVPGLSGRTVTRMLVSRDGSRLVAVVRGRKVDRVVSARVRHDPAGAIVGFTPLRTLPLPAEGSARIRDIGWRSATSVSVLDVTDDGRFSQVRTVSVDGAPGETSGTTRLRGPTRLLVSTPVDGLEAYALDGRAVFSLTRPERTVPDLPRGLTSLTYVG